MKPMNNFSTGCRKCLHLRAFSDPTNTTALEPITKSKKGKKKGGVKTVSETKPKKFVKNSSAYFLTYSRSKLQAATVATRLKKLVASRGIKINYLIVGEERHQNANEDLKSPIKHLHVLLILNKKLFIRNSEFFDLSKMHPNIECPRDRTACRNYCMKEGNFREHGKWNEPIKTTSRRVGRNNAATAKVKCLHILLEHGLSKATLSRYPEAGFQLQGIAAFLEVYNSVGELSGYEDFETEGKFLFSEERINLLRAEFHKLNLFPNPDISESDEDEDIREID